MRNTYREKIKREVKKLLDRKQDELILLLNEIESISNQLGIAFPLSYSLSAKCPCDALERVIERMREDKVQLKEALRLLDETFFLLEKVQVELQKAQTKEFDDLLFGVEQKLNTLRTQYMPQRRWQSFRERINRVQASLGDALNKITRNMCWEGLEKYYRILGVPIGVGPEEIKEAYRFLARKYHPDMHPKENKKLVEEKFKELIEAYEKIMNEIGG